MENAMGSTKMSFIYRSLWVGSVTNAMDVSMLQSVRITHIVNATAEEENFFPQKFVYHRVPLYDKTSERAAPYFDQVIEFISAAHAAGGLVLIHCQEGISRSVTLALAYRMVTEHISLGKAFADIKLVRPEAEPNPGFLQELRELERRVLGKLVTKEKLTRFDWGALDRPGTGIDRLRLSIRNLLAVRKDDGVNNKMAKQTLDDVRTAAAEVAPKELKSGLPEIIYDVLENFGGSSSRDKTAWTNFAFLLNDIAQLNSQFGAIMSDTMASLPSDEQWLEVCLDSPLAPTLINQLRLRIVEKKQQNA
jgi:protein-tyrosine phosphatase